MKMKFMVLLTILCVRANAQDVSIAKYKCEMRDLSTGKGISDVAYFLDLTQDGPSSPKPGFRRIRLSEVKPTGSTILSDNIIFTSNTDLGTVFRPDGWRGCGEDSECIAEVYLTNERRPRTGILSIVRRHSDATRKFEMYNCPIL